jgi:hypothetical protein
MGAILAAHLGSILGVMFGPFMGAILGANLGRILGEIFAAIFEVITEANLWRLQKNLLAYLFLKNSTLDLIIFEIKTKFSFTLWVLNQSWCWMPKIQLTSSHHNTKNLLMHSEIAKHQKTRIKLFQTRQNLS